jgi:AraC-like DNA-binding protein
MKANIPVLSACDLFTKQQNQQNIVVYCVDELLKKDIFIPKKPHRHTFYQIVYIWSGSGIHKIDFKEYLAKEHSLFFLGPGQVHHLKLSADTKGVLINFDESFFYTYLVKPDIISNYPFFNPSGKYSHIPIDKNSIDILDVFKRIRTQRKNTVLVRLYLLELFEIIDKKLDSISKSKDSNSQQLMAKFETLLEDNFDIEHSTMFYAEKMFITPNYLNALCKKTKGITSSSIIQGRILLEAKRLLVNSKLNIAEIAYLLGFDDNSYFTKFFKKKAGLSPKQFRKTL